jgi:hypothetical protein
MTAESLVTQLRDEIAQSRAGGHDVIALESLDAHLVQLLAWEARDEGFQNRAHASALEAYRAGHQSNVEMFKSVITYGTEALKAAMIINGAAAAAVLAFLGAASGTAVHGQARLSSIDGMTMFAYGVLTATLGFGFAYLTQRLYLTAADSRGGAARAGHISGAMCIGLFVVAMALFGAGALSVRMGLRLLA